MPLNPPIRATRTVHQPDEFFNGIPNRDLTESDWLALDDDQRRTVQESGLWTVEPDEKIAPKVERFEARVARTAEKAAEQTERTVAKEGGD
jgi:hypothetical protein